MRKLDAMLTEIKSIESLIAKMNPEDERDVEETLYWIQYCVDIGLKREERVRMILAELERDMYLLQRTIQPADKKGED